MFNISGKSTLHGICLLQQSGKLNVRENDTTKELVEEFLKQFLSPSK